MSYSSAIVLTKKAKLVSGHFGNTSKKYTFKTFFEDIEIGDYVVVQVSTNANSPFGLAIIKITEIDNIEINPNIEYKWVVDNINIPHFKLILQEEQIFIDKIKSKTTVIKNKEIAKNLGMSLIELNKLAPKWQ